MDYGTAEIAKRLTVVPSLHGTGYDRHGKVVDETEVDRLLMRDDINSVEHSALTAFAGLLHRANMNRIKTQSFEPPVTSDPSQAARIMAGKIVIAVRVIAVLDEKIGREDRMKLVNLVLLDSAWSGGKRRLRKCVKALYEIMG